MALSKRRGEVGRQTPIYGRASHKWGRGGVNIMNRKLLLCALASVGLVVAAALPAGGSVTISEFGTPSPNTRPGSITVGPNGEIWFTEFLAQNIGNLTPTRSTPPTFDFEFNASGYPGNIVLGSDGNLWFTLPGEKNSIGRMTPGGQLTTFPLPTPPQAGPRDIAAGSDGNLWFTEDLADQIGRITPSGTITEFPVPVSGVAPEKIAAGPDGNLWFTTINSDLIGKVQTDGTITETHLVGANDIAAGPNGDMFVTIPGGGLANFNPKASPLHADIFPGTVNGKKVAGQSIAPSACANKMWFTYSGSGPGSGGIASVSTGGVNVQIFTAPSGVTSFDDLTAGPDGTVWFTEYKADQIARGVDTSALVRCVFLLASNQFLSSTLNSVLGGQVGWQGMAPGIHGVADASGLFLFGLQPTGAPIPLPIGAFTTYSYRWSGTFPYDDPFHTSTRGTFGIPPLVGPLPGAPGARVTWAISDAPTGDVFDVQVKPPGARSWDNWLVGTTSVSGGYGSTSPFWNGPGTYAFRARLRSSSGPGGSGFSPATSFRLSA